MIELYTLSDPRDGAMRYIGKAKCARKRLQTHITDARQRKTPVYVWINELLAIRAMPVLTVVEQCEDGTWPERERALIAEARASGERLLNLAPGGNQPHCPTEVCAANGAKNAKDRVSTPRRKRLWQLRQALGGMLKRGEVSEATKAKMRARPDVFGWARL